MKRMWKYSVFKRQRWQEVPNPAGASGDLLTWLNNNYSKETDAGRTDRTFMLTLWRHIKDGTYVVETEISADGTSEFVVVDDYPSLLALLCRTTQLTQRMMTLENLPNDGDSAEESLRPLRRRRRRR